MRSFLPDLENKTERNFQLFMALWQFFTITYLTYLVDAARETQALTSRLDNRQVDSKTKMIITC